VTHPAAVFKIPHEHVMVGGEDGEGALKRREWSAAILVRRCPSDAPSGNGSVQVNLTRSSNPP
jgi:hypothetical protein